MQTKRKGTKKDCSTAKDLRLLKNLPPILRQRFGAMALEKQEAERKSTLALLRIIELVVTGRLPQAAGEDYFAATSRLILHGPADAKASFTAKRRLKKALTELKASRRWTTTLADVAQMRRWRGKRAVTRTILLLTVLEKIIGRVGLTEWLRRSNPNLGGQAPANVLEAGRWVMLADFVDDMLTGSPT